MASIEHSADLASVLIQAEEIASEAEQRLSTAHVLLARGATDRIKSVRLDRDTKKRASEEALSQSNYQPNLKPDRDHAAQSYRHDPDRSK